MDDPDTYDGALLAEIHDLAARLSAAETDRDGNQLAYEGVLGSLALAEARVEAQQETLAIAEMGLDNIARLAELNAEEPGWQVEVHRIACECWRQVVDARAALSAGQKEQQ